MRAGAAIAARVGIGVIATGLGLAGVRPARADCVTVGSVSTCSNFTPGGIDFGTVSGRTVTVQPGAVLGSGLSTDALRITNNSFVSAAAVTNYGTINGSITMLSAGSGLDSFTNSGLITFTSLSSVVATSGISMAGGTFTQTAQGTLAFRTDANSFSDTLLAWRANLGGRFVALVQPGLYDRTTTYSTVISATAGRTGTFASVESSSPFFTATPTYVGNDMDLTLTRISFDQVPGSKNNARSIGRALEAGYSTALTGTAATAYSNLLASTAPNVLAQLTGEVATAGPSAAFAGFSQFFGAVLGQAANARTGSTTTGSTGGESRRIALAGPEACLADTCEPRPGFERKITAWLQGIGTAGSIDGDDAIGSSRVEYASGGLATGFDMQLDEHFTLGVTVGYSDTSYNLSSVVSSGQVRTTVVGLYGSYNDGPLYVDAAAAYGAALFTTTRQVATGSIGERVDGATKGSQYGGRIETGWRLAYDRHSLTPFAGVAVQALSQESYTEDSHDTTTGAPGAFGLTVQPQVTTSVRSLVGAQMATGLQFGRETLLSPRLRLGWAHEFNTDRSATMTLATLSPGNAFTVQGARPAADALVVRAGFDLDFGRSVRVYAQFDGEFGGTARSYGGSAGVRLVW